MRQDATGQRMLETLLDGVSTRRLPAGDPGDSRNGGRLALSSESRSEAAPKKELAHFDGLIWPPC